MPFWGIAQYAGSRIYRLKYGFGKIYCFYQVFDHGLNCDCYCCAVYLCCGGAWWYRPVEAVQRVLHSTGGDGPV